MWCHLDKVSRSYGCMRIATLLFLSIYSLHLSAPPFLRPHNTLPVSWFKKCLHTLDLAPTLCFLLMITRSLTFDCVTTITCAIVVNVIILFANIFWSVTLQNKSSEYYAPLTSFDWNETDINIFKYWHYWEVGTTGVVMNVYILDSVMYIHNVRHGSIIIVMVAQ